MIEVVLAADLWIGLPVTPFLVQQDFLNVAIAAEINVDGLRCLAALRHGIDQAGRTEHRIAAGKHAGATGQQAVLAHLDTPLFIVLHTESGDALNLLADGGDDETLVRHAESAMQRAKQGGRGCFRFHQADCPESRVLP